MNDLNNQGYITAPIIDIELQQETKVDYVIEYRYFRGIAPISFSMIKGRFL